MSAFSIGLVFFMGCPKPTPVAGTVTGPVVEIEPDEELVPREVWGGVSGFRVFAIKDPVTAGWLGSFAVQDDPTPQGAQHASTYQWTYGDQREAWEWGANAWPTGGFILDVEPTATRGTDTIDVFTHTAFPPTASSLPPLNGGNLTVYRLDRVTPNSPTLSVGWLIVETDASGEAVELTWARDLAAPGAFITVANDQELHAIPVNDPGLLPQTALIIMQQPE
jgi:hypothetical protein